MKYFLTLPRYQFRQGIFDSAPEDSGIAGLFEEAQLLCVIPTANIKGALRDLRSGVFGKWPVQATHYTWHITMTPDKRCREVLEGFLHANGVPPKFQGFIQDGIVYGGNGVRKA